VEVSIKAAMSKPAFYKPPPRWHFFVALIAALALEMAAVAVASRHQIKEIPIETGALEDEGAEIIFTELPPDLPQPPDDHTPPVAPLPPDDPTDFAIIEPPQPATIETTKSLTKRLRVVATHVKSHSPNLNSGNGKMIFAPQPAYPFEARRAKQTGSGRFLLSFDGAGTVTGVKIVQSTGSPLLDQVSVSAFGRWKCRPGDYDEVIVPVTFTLGGSRL
jgi:TonB family protein